MENTTSPGENHYWVRKMKVDHDPEHQHLLRIRNLVMDQKHLLEALKNLKFENSPNLGLRNGIVKVQEALLEQTRDLFHREILNRLDFRSSAVDDQFDICLNGVTKGWLEPGLGNPEKPGILAIILGYCCLDGTHYHGEIEVLCPPEDLDGPDGQDEGAGIPGFENAVLPHELARLAEYEKTHWEKSLRKWVADREMEALERRLQKIP